VNLWKTSMKRVALALLATAVVVPAAHAGSRGPLAGFSHLQELTAMGNRYQAAQLAPTLSGYSHLQELTAMANLYKAQAGKLAMPPGNSHLQELTAMNNEYQRQASKLASVRMPVSSTAGGFDWADAGIGAMSGFSAALALAGALLFVLRRRLLGQGRTATTA
jgi:hypothetical protein